MHGAPSTGILSLRCSIVACHLVDPGVVMIVQHDRPSPWFKEAYLATEQQLEKRVQVKDGSRIRVPGVIYRRSIMSEQQQQKSILVRQSFKDPLFQAGFIDDPDEVRLLSRSCRYTRCGFTRRAADKDVVDLATIIKSMTSASSCRCGVP